MYNFKLYTWFISSNPLVGLLASFGKQLSTLNILKTLFFT